MIWLSCDPGLNGAIVIWENETPLRYIRLRSLACNKLLTLSGDMLPEKIEQVVMERVNGIPGDGAVASFTFGYVTGMLTQFFRERCDKVLTVPPRLWQETMHKGLSRTIPTKTRSIRIGQAMYPKFTADLVRRDDGVFDALLIGAYAYHTGLNESPKAKNVRRAYTKRSTPCVKKVTR